MLEIIKERQVAIQNQLQGIAQKHADRSNGMFTVLPIDQDTYPGQSLLDSYVKGNPIDPAYSDELASAIDKRYKPFKTFMDNKEQSTSSLLRIGETLASGQNVINGSDHAELIDIALSQLAITNSLKQRGYTFNTGIIVSKMVDFLGVSVDGNTIPARVLFEQAFDRTYLTVPRSASTKGKFDELSIKAYNKHVRSVIAGDLNRRPRSNKIPMLLGAALPGTVNKFRNLPVDKNSAEKTLVIGHVSDGILSFSNFALTYATAVRLDKPDLYIDDVGFSLRQPEHITSFMGRMVLNLQKLDDETYVYDMSGDLPVL
ncbi:MAG: hypothetical protein WCJ60_03175 [bacterium]